MTPMTRCDEGHFFDGSQNKRCPFCGVGSTDLPASPAADAGPTVRYEPTGGDDKTQMYTSSGTQGAGATQGAGDGATIAVWAVAGIDPVVGWLVCIEGKNQGRDYRIRSGFNSIGRDTSNQICIAGDETIGREEHAKIFYDPENATFSVLSANGRSGIYLNGKAVLQPTEMSAYDQLKLGMTKLLFVPFCGGRFRWDLGS